VTISPGTVIAVPDSLFAVSPVPYAAKGTISFDGAGGILIEATRQAHEDAFIAGELTGSYALSGCTLQATFANGSELGVRIVGSRGRYFLASTTPGFVILREPETLATERLP
jgi:hypothetical protein